MPEPSSTDVVVLCAGLGKRLRPLTNTIPKALVPVAGKPLLAYHLEAMRDVGIRRVICIVGYLEDKIREFVGDGSSFGLKVQFVSQIPPKGTGDAVSVVASLIKSDPFAVLYADVFFYPMRPVWESLLDGNTAKIVCARVENTAQFGRVETYSSPQGDMLSTIMEKDGKTRPGLVNAGLLLLPKSILRVLNVHTVTERGEVELPQAVEQISKKGTRILVNQVGDWFDIGSLSALESASRFATSVGDDEG
jgi:bifunctional UDP-N-acetylglucosamine pyrophosphorylase/glucosamine-1-phosphate N-acetyltransferase